MNPVQPVAISAIPESESLHGHVADRFGIPPFSEFENPLQIAKFEFVDPGLWDRLSKEILQTVTRLGFHGFIDLFSEHSRRVEFYGGLGLTFNENYIHDVIPDYLQVLGAPRKNLGDFLENPLGAEALKAIYKGKLDKEFFYQFLNGRFDIAKYESILEENQIAYMKDFLDRQLIKEFPHKNSYSDCWGFTSFTDAVGNRTLRKTLESVRASVVRSRVGICKTWLATEIDMDMLWHRDENPLLESRLVIPIRIPGRTYVELGRDPNRRFQLREREAYFWDTSQIHRVYQSQECREPSMNLVIGFSPWFDVKKSDDQIIPSESFGEPLLRLFASGKLLPFLRFRGLF